MGSRPELSGTDIATRPASEKREFCNGLSGRGFLRQYQQGSSPVISIPGEKACLPPIRAWRPAAGARIASFILPPEEFSIVPQTTAVTSPSFPAHRLEPDHAGFAPAENGVPVVRHDWSAEEAAAIYQAPFMDLLLRAQTTHRLVFDPNKVQFSKLLNVKAGGCPEDCGYCSQSAHHDAGLQASKLMDPAQVIEEAKAAKAAGATRYCMGAAWRSPKARDMAPVIEMVKGVKALGMETCMTLGMLSQDQARQLADAGLDYYNHNIDTSERFYSEIVRTRTFGDRLETLRHVEASGMKVCCGGILGMGEQPLDRVEMLRVLANLPEHPQSVPVNMLIPIPGTPLAKAEPVDPISFVRTIALARILMPMSDVRLSAGRSAMTDEMQALCFFAGANSIFIGDTLLTAANPSEDRDHLLLRRLGMERLAAQDLPALA
jgi:biotin synthase